MFVLWQMKVVCKNVTRSISASFDGKFATLNQLSSSKNELSGFAQEVKHYWSLTN